MPPEMEVIIEQLLGKFFWMVIGIAFWMIVKDTIKEWFSGFAIFVGNDFNEDDIVYINGRKARVNRCGMRKTVFIMLDVEPRRKWPVMNHRLAGMNIEKTLPVNGMKEIHERLDALEKKENGDTI